MKRGLELREENWLQLMRSEVYENPNCPYLKLLKLAGCELSDLNAAVRREGLEPTLERLALEGVYLTADEFKGKKEVIRGQTAFKVSPTDFNRHGLSPGFVTQSSGTNNLPVRSLITLDWLHPRAITTCLFFAAHGLFDYSQAMYDAILPGEGGINNLLIYSKLGVRVDRWFGRRVPVDGWFEAQYHYVTSQIIISMARRYGPGCPRPEFIEVDQLDRIVRWAEDNRKTGKSTRIKTTASNGARIAQLAWDMGISLSATQFDVTGEPLTDSKNDSIERSGARATSRYGSSMGLNLGYGCPHRSYVDEMHVDQHMFALIQHPRSLSGHAGPIHPLLLSTLYPTAPRLLLNVANGDYARVGQRNCGCRLERIGLGLHLFHIRSYEKFTSEGMNYFFGDLYELVEKTLPLEFGGSPGDYQLVEEEDHDGRTLLSLVVHPRVGGVDEKRLLARIQESFSQSSRDNRLMTRVWQEAGTFRVKREVPHSSPRGKILPLQIKR